MKSTAIYPGTFDPITYGHIDVIRKSLKIFDRVVVAAAENINKDYLFSVDERVQIIRDSLFKDLKRNAVIGTSSYRRQFQIKKIRPDVNCKLIRGNVDTRIKKLMDGEYDAIILSYAGIKYLKLEDKISEIFSIEEIIPSAGQGIIAIQCRVSDEDMISMLKKINHKKTSLYIDKEVPVSLNEETPIIADKVILSIK